MADEFDAFLNADSGDDGGVLGAVLGAADAAADWIFGEDDDDTVFGLGGTDGGLPVPAGDYGAQLAGLNNPAAQQAAMQLVSAIMGSGVIGTIARGMLDRLPGVIFDAREPQWTAGPLTEAMLSILFRQLSKNEQEAVIERLAGGMSPLSNSDGVRKVYRVLYVYDALRSLNEEEAARAIFYGADK